MPGSHTDCRGIYFTFYLALPSLLKLWNFFSAPESLYPRSANPPPLPTLEIYQSKVKIVQFCESDRCEVAGVFSPNSFFLWRCSWSSHAHAPGGSTSMLVRFPIRMLMKRLMSMLLMVSCARAHGACASTTTLRKSASWLRQRRRKILPYLFINFTNKLFQFSCDVTEDSF